MTSHSSVTESGNAGLDRVVKSTHFYSFHSARVPTVGQALYPGPQSQSISGVYMGSCPLVSVEGQGSWEEEGHQSCSPATHLPRDFSKIWARVLSRMWVLDGSVPILGFETSVFKIAISISLKHICMLYIL